MLCGFFYSECDQTLPPALQKKGFHVSVTSDVPSFLKHLESETNWDVLVIVSGASVVEHEAFKEKVLKAHKSGVGLFIFGDNVIALPVMFFFFISLQDPYYAHANLLLPSIAGCELVGNDHGASNLVFGDDPSEAGRFDAEHLIFSGINRLFEGITICFPHVVDKELYEKVVVCATSTYDQPVICRVPSTETTGRVVIDTGFTKLFPQFWKTDGQARYIVNACVWLVDIEKRYGKEEPVFKKDE